MTAWKRNESTSTRRTCALDIAAIADGSPAPLATDFTGKVYIRLGGGHVLTVAGGVLNNDGYDGHWVYTATQAETNQDTNEVEVRIIDGTYFAQTVVDIIQPLDTDSFTSAAQQTLFGVETITADSGGTFSRTRCDLTPGSSSTLDDFYTGAIAYIISGTGAGGWATVDRYVNSGSLHTLTLAGDGFPAQPGVDSVVAIVRASRYATSDSIMLTLDGPASVLEGGHTLGDHIRLHTAVLFGKVQDFNTGVLVFKSLDGTKPRGTTTTDASGRINSVVGDLTP